MLYTFLCFRNFSLHKMANLLHKLEFVINKTYFELNNFMFKYVYDEILGIPFEIWSILGSHSYFFRKYLHEKIIYWFMRVSFILDPPVNKNTKNYAIFLHTLTKCNFIPEWSLLHNKIHSILMSYLNGLDVVSVVAQNSWEFDLPDLVQLLQGEGRGPAAVLIPKIVKK